MFGVLKIFFDVIFLDFTSAGILVLCPVVELICCYVAIEVFRHHDIRGGDFMPLVSKGVHDVGPLLDKVAAGDKGALAALHLLGAGASISQKDLISMAEKGLASVSQKDV